MTILYKPSLEIKNIETQCDRIISEAQEEWAKFGFVPFSRPDGSSYPELPNDLADLPPNSLINILVALRQWSAYIGEQMIKWRSKKDILATQVKAIKGRVMEELKKYSSANAKNLSVEERKMVLEANPDVIEAEGRLKKVEYVLENLNFRNEQLSKMHATVSRALSIRQAEMEMLKSKYPDEMAFPEHEDG